MGGFSDADHVPIGVLAWLLAITSLANAKEATQPKRARPPQWMPDVLDVFVPDARTTLVGSRPDYDKSAHVATAPASPTASPTEAGNPPPAAFADGWSKSIDAETIETEVKRLSQELAKTVTVPAQFKGGGYKDCRRQFSMLAALFAVAAEYDGEVRWKDAAPTIRNVFAKAGHNCKVGTDQTFQEAVRTQANLADLVAGNRPKPSAADVKANWPQVADRPPLMQRLNIAQQDRLAADVAIEQERVLGSCRRHQARSPASPCLRTSLPGRLRILGR